MNTDRNRATAQRFFELFSASDLDGVMALMTDDATWRIPGKKELTPTAGVYTKERIGRLFRRMLDNLTSGSADDRRSPRLRKETVSRWKSRPQAT